MRHARTVSWRAVGLVSVLAGLFDLSAGHATARRLSRLASPAPRAGGAGDPRRRLTGGRAALARKLLLRLVGDETILGELARRLVDSRTRDTHLLDNLVQRVPVKVAGELAERLRPVRRLDYRRHHIELVIGSPSVSKRLRSAEKEPFTVEWIERALEPGDVFYDVGANVGAYALIAAKATGNRARVFAFEPSASTFHDLARNIRLNGCEPSIVALPMALWSETELIPIALRSSASGASRHRLGPEPGGAEPPREMILGVRLDDLVERFGIAAPTHAKIDVDGYELQVLQGAERTLRRPEWRSILLELDRDETERNRQIRALLAGLGFGPGRKHEWTPTPRYPDPSARPNLYWTFERRSP